MLPEEHREQVVTIEGGEGAYTAACTCGWTHEYHNLRINNTATLHTNSHLRTADLMDDVEWLIESGVGMTEAARRLGFTSRKNLDRAMRRIDRPDLAHKLQERDWLFVAERETQGQFGRVA